jgi:hypothetical protein
MPGYLVKQARIMIDEFLAESFHSTAESYRRFSQSKINMEMDARTFREYHTACRSALLHVEKLIKLIEWCHPPQAPVPPGPAAPAILDAAHIEMADYEARKQADFAAIPPVPEKV